MGTSEHELLICDLLAPARRARYRKLLDQGTAKARKKFVDGLNHTLELDARFATRVSDAQGDACESEGKWILGELQRRGAPDVCYVISSNGELDQRTMPLEEALREVYGCFLGTLICCLPGRLAYYEGEDLGERYILHRSATPR